MQPTHSPTNTEDFNWPLVLKPWLKSNQNNRLTAFLICGCVAQFFKDDLTMLELSRSDSQLLIQYFSAAAESAQLSVELDNGLVRLPALVIVRSLSNLYIELKVLPQPKEIFCIVGNLLFTGGNPERKAACLFMSALHESIGCTDMIDSFELPILEVLEQLQESDDPELKKVAQNTLFTLQGQGIYLVKYCLHNACLIILYSFTE